MKDTSLGHYLCQTVSRLRKPSLEECWHEIAKTCQKCGYQVLTICFTSVHVFKDQVIKDMILIRSREIKKFKDLESQVLNSVVVMTWWHGVATQCNIFKTWHAKSWTNCGCQVLTIMFTCGHVLEDQTMKDISLGHYLPQTVSRLEKPSLEECTYEIAKKKSELWLPSVDNLFHFCSCLQRPSHEGHNPTWV